jgi:hypothetical protein
VTGLAAALLLTAWSGLQEPKVSAVRVHGNHTTPDVDVTKLAGVGAGDPAPPDLEVAVAERLRKSGRFERVEVRRRYASLDTTGDILLVIIVTEHPGIVEDPTVPSGIRYTRRLLGGGMFLPILDYEDGYGFTYGLRTSFANFAGQGTRLSIPATWGGTRQIATQFEWAQSPVSTHVKKRTLPFSRITTAGSYSRRENPFYEIGDVRGAVLGRAERIFTRPLRGGVYGGWTHVDFEPLSEHFSTLGLDLTFDTRRDPELSRGAVFLKGDVERLWFESGPSYRYRADARGFIPFIRQSVIALRVYRESSDSPLPPYERALLGGATDQRGTLRGFPAGFATGDNLFTTSAELRVPLTSPLNVGRLGVSAFFDAGAAYDRGVKLEHVQFSRGVGAGVFLHFTIVKLNLDVARGLGHGTRVHLSSGFTF